MESPFPFGRRLPTSEPTPSPRKPAVLVFKKPGYLADITFQVEGQQLHFWKMLLSVASPVFERMFDSQIKEKDSQVIPLPEKKVEDVDLFLQNMHPEYAWKPLDDDTLGILLSFASEYQIELIRQKCLHYIDYYITCLEGKGSVPSKGLPSRAKPEIARKIVFYLSLCEQYELPELKNRLIGHAASVPLKELEDDEFYKRLSDTSQKGILRTRCLALESKLY